MRSRTRCKPKIVLIVDPMLHDSVDMACLPLTAISTTPQSRSTDLKLYNGVKHRPTTGYGNTLHCMQLSTTGTYAGSVYRPRFATWMSTRACSTYLTRDVCMPFDAYLAAVPRGCHDFNDGRINHELYGGLGYKLVYIPIFATVSSGIRS